MDRREFVTSIPGLAVLPIIAAGSAEQQSSGSSSLQFAWVADPLYSDYSLPSSHLMYLGMMDHDGSSVDPGPFSFSEIGRLFQQGDGMYTLRICNMFHHFNTTDLEDAKSQAEYAMVAWLQRALVVMEKVAFRLWPAKSPRELAAK